MRLYKFLTPLFLLSSAFLIRLIPMAMSPLPYNIDGFPLVKISENLISQGHWHLGQGPQLITYNSKMPGFSFLLSAACLLFGTLPLSTVQWFVPLFTTASLLVVYIYALKLSKNSVMAFSALCFLSFTGLFVYLTTAAMKETLGLAIFPAIIYLYTGRADKKKRLFAALLLLLLPLIHQLTTLVMFTVLWLYYCTELVLKKPCLNKTLLDFLSGPALVLPAYIYYRTISIEQMDQIAQKDDLLLFLSVFLFVWILSVVILSKEVPQVAKKKRVPAGFWVLIGAALLLLFNHFTEVFGVISTPAPLLLYIVPYLAVVSFAVWGASIVKKVKLGDKNLITSLFLGPFTIILFAFLRCLDPASLNLMYRTYDYIDFGLAFCVGVGIAYAFRHIGHTKKLYIGPIAVGFLCMSTLPLAYQPYEMYGVESVTYPYEFEGMRFVSDLGMSVQTDQRIGDILSPYFYLNVDRTFPLHANETYELRGLAMFEGRWMTKGAQEYPLDNVIFANETFVHLTNDFNLMYMGGIEGDRVYVVLGMA